MKLELSPELLIKAYSHGFFPMPESNGEIHWYRPDPRAILPLDAFHISRSLSRCIRKKVFTLSFDKNFRQVMEACANRPETWITSEFIELYTELFKRGFAHSVEVWQDGVLVGGVYGVCLGRAFFAESMFHLKTDASKFALHALVEKLREKEFSLLEVQFLTSHLSSLGAIEISHGEYMKMLEKALN